MVPRGGTNHLFLLVFIRPSLRVSPYKYGRNCPNVSCPVRPYPLPLGGYLGGYKMRAINRLTSQFVKTAAVGKHCDGAGLWLVKRDDGGAQWVQRVTVHGRRREMGLGG